MIASLLNHSRPKFASAEEWHTHIKRIWGRPHSPQDKVLRDEPMLAVTVWNSMDHPQCLPFADSFRLIRHAQSFGNQHDSFFERSLKTTGENPELNSVSRLIMNSEVVR